ncbi:phage tail tape measure protein [Xanthobacter agilis]|uniref:Uncharacterized protein n=1 Tax=Xanthobacter agilis TaxID=47492 RepID=A0ABU0LJU8_XANAG|nr:hypothetical protein [Xanthobacter agilis]MDQ0507414.1 hypothetical protein [Xanthobacter agilis]
MLKAGAFLDRLEHKAKELFASTTTDLDHLNAVANRAGTSIEEVRALAYALQQTGVSGGRAEGILDSFASHLRRFPALTGVLHNLGVKTRQNGQIRDTAEVFADTIKAINKIQDYPTAVRTADLFGITEEDYYNLRTNAAKIEKFKADQKDAYKRYGVNGKEAGISSTLVMQGWRRMLMNLDAMLGKIALALGPALMPIIDDLKAWLEKHQDKIVAVCVALVAALSDLVTKVQEWSVAVFGSGQGLLDFLEWMTSGNGLLRAIEIIGGGWMAMTVAGILGPLGLVIAGIVALIAALMPGKAEAAPAGGGQAQGGQAQAAPQKQGFLGRAKSFIGKLFGYGGAEGEGGAGGGTDQAAAPTSTEPAMSLSDARKRFAKEMEDPEVAARFAGYIEAETGGNGAKAQQAFAESVLNRAASRRQTLRQALDEGYFPGTTHRRASGYMRDPRYLQKYRKIMDAVLGGSNISNYATGNASEDVQFNKGYQTLESGGERFGVEGPDRGWVGRMKEFDESTKTKEPERPKIIIDKPFAAPDQKSLYAPPLGSTTDTFALAADQETEIVVHGDPDPSRTTSEVSAAQLRVNRGLTDQVERAVA